MKRTTRRLMAPALVIILSGVTPIFGGKNKFQPSEIAIEGASILQTSATQNAALQKALNSLPQDPTAQNIRPFITQVPAQQQHTLQDTDLTCNFSELVVNACKAWKHQFSLAAQAKKK